MKTYPIFLQPVFKERIWGGTAIQDVFSYDVKGENIGECWGISAHPHGQSLVKNGVFQGKTLGDLWEEHRELFGDVQAASFPLMTKILDARMDLSIQVHPDDEYAQKWEKGSNGKTECWYVIDCKAGAEIIYGHHAESREEWIQMLEKHRYEQLWRSVPIHPGDFFYVPSGTIHALGAGTLILETQQNSDVTYRIYDYDRTDSAGRKRELHRKQAKEVISFPHVDHTIVPITICQGNTKITRYLANEYFTVEKWDIKDRTNSVQTENFLLLSIIGGQGVLYTEEDHYSFKKGDFMILPSGLGDYTIEGNSKIIVSYQSNNQH